MDNGTLVKTCKDCLVEQSIENFHFYSRNNKKNNKYRMPRCKPCFQKYKAVKLKERTEGPITVNTKQCKGCLTRLSKYHFRRNNNTKSRLRDHCRVCEKGYKIAEKVREVDRMIQERKKKPSE